jgi:hypothetical protein
MRIEVQPEKSDGGRLRELSHVRSFLGLCTKKAVVPNGLLLFAEEIFCNIN